MMNVNTNQHSIMMEASVDMASNSNKRKKKTSATMDSNDAIRTVEKRATLEHSPFQSNMKARSVNQTTASTTTMRPGDARSYSSGNQSFLSASSSSKKYTNSDNSNRQWVHPTRTNSLISSYYSFRVSLIILFLFILDLFYFN